MKGRVMVGVRRMKRSERMKVKEERGERKKGWLRVLTCENFLKRRNRRKRREGKGLDFN